MGDTQRVIDDNNFGAGFTFDPGYANFFRTQRSITSANQAGRDDRIAAHEPFPVRGIAQGSLDTRRRNFEDVPFPDVVTLFKFCLDRPRCPRTIVHCDLFAIRALDSDIQQRPVFRARYPELKKLQSKGYKFVCYNGL